MRSGEGALRVTKAIAWGAAALVGRGSKTSFGDRRLQQYLLVVTGIPTDYRG